MFLIQLFLLCVSMFFYAGDDKQLLQTSGLSGATVKIQCSDETEPSEYPLEAINLFVTVKNMIDDLGNNSELPIPLAYATKLPFKCLTDFAQYTTKFIR